MRDYESIYIVNPNIGEDNVKAAVEKFTNMFEKSAKVDNINEWGRRKLAYPINKINEGHYVLINFSSDVDFTRELERVYKISDEIIKYMIIRK
jgi:small subunit ribosomal protein S6